MNDRFGTLLSWWDESASVGFEEVEREVRNILAQHKIRLRQDDGYLVQMNFSLPVSHSGLVLGLRYGKRNGTFTEDHFLVNRRETRLQRTAATRSVTRQSTRSDGTTWRPPSRRVVRSIKVNSR